MIFQTIVLEQFQNIADADNNILIMQSLVDSDPSDQNLEKHGKLNQHWRKLFFKRNSIASKTLELSGYKVTIIKNSFLRQ